MFVDCDWDYKSGSYIFKKMRLEVKTFYFNDVPYYWFARTSQLIQKSTLIERGDTVYFKQTEMDIGILTPPKKKRP